MKTLEELAKMVTGDITAILPKIILDAVEAAARARRFGRSLVRVNTDLVGKPGRSLHVPKRGTMLAARVGEGIELNAFTGGTSPAYSTIEITPFKIVSYAAITEEAVAASEFNLIKDHITEAGEALADLEDREILMALIGAHPILNEVVVAAAAGVNMGPLANIPIYCIDSYVGDVTGTEFVATTTAIDHPAGLFKNSVNIAGGADNNVLVDYWYKDTAVSPEQDIHLEEVAGLTAFTYADIVKANLGIRAQKFSGNFMVLNPAQTDALIKDARFIDTSQYGSSEPILTGEIGKISGFKLLATTQMCDGTILFLDSTRAAYLVIKRNVDMKRWDNPRTDSTELYFYFEFMPRVVVPEAIFVMYSADALAV